MAWNMLWQSMIASHTEQVVFPPPRKPLEAIWPVLMQLAWLPIVTRLFSTRGLPRGYIVSQRLLIAHIILSYLEAARFHLGSLRYNAPHSPWWSPADTPPLPTAFDFALTVVNCWLAVWIAKKSRYGDPKIVRTSLQMIAVLRLCTSVPAYLAIRQATSLASIDPAKFASSIPNSTIPTAVQVQGNHDIEIAALLAKAARLHSVSCGALDGFAMARIMIAAITLAGWFPSRKDAGNWGNMLALSLRASTVDLPGGLWSIYGLMFVLNAIQDAVGWVVRKR
jgi:hypothetical protein